MRNLTGISAGEWSICAVKRLRCLPGEISTSVYFSFSLGRGWFPRHTCFSLLLEWEESEPACWKVSRWREPQYTHALQFPFFWHSTTPLNAMVSPVWGAVGFTPPWTKPPVSCCGGEGRGQRSRFFQVWGRIPDLGLKLFPQHCQPLPSFQLHLLHFLVSLLSFGVSNKGTMSCFSNFLTASLKFSLLILLNYTCPTTFYCSCSLGPGPGVYKPLKNSPFCHFSRVWRGGKSKRGQWTCHS